MDIGPIAVKYEWTNDLTIAKQWLDFLSTKPLLAADFEAASHYSDADREKFLSVLNDEKSSYLVKKEVAACLASTPLDFPAHVDITHLSVAWSDSEAYVFVLDSFEITKLVLTFLTSTEIKQIWHNACYDFRLIYYFTGKMPKNYEDTQIYAKTLFNHVNVHKANTGLKELAGSVYGAWGLSSDNFTKAEMYTPKMLLYAATDACATFWVYTRITSNVDDKDVEYPNTMVRYSPWEQLPAPTPKGAVYGESYFYHKTAKWLVRDTVRLMVNGLPISLTEVQKLEKELEVIIADVEHRLDTNPLVKQFLATKQQELEAAYITLQRQKMKTWQDFYKDFDHKNILHRSMFMKLFCEKTDITPPETVVEDGIPKWSVALLRKFAPAYRPLQCLLAGDLTTISKTASEAARQVAVYKAEMYNKKYEALIQAPNIKQLRFNPSSPKQKQEFFAMLGLESDEQSKKTGEDSWNREQIERVNKETEDEDIRTFTQSLIDYSYAAIVRDNFVQSFYRYTVDGRLHGSYKLLGAKSCRYTSSNPRNNWALCK